MINLKSKAREVAERGYCLIESVCDEKECDQIRTIFKGLCDKRGGFSAEQPTIGFHPLLELGPEMAPFFVKSILVDAMEEVLQDDVRLAHTGAAVFSNAPTQPILTSWHVHYAWEIPPTGLQRENPERILCGIYVDGSDREIGPLIVLPRRLNDSVDAKGDGEAVWEGEEEVVMSPGSAVIFDTAVWHCSRHGTGGTQRHIWGGHYQGWSNPTPHPEDNTADNPIVNEHRDKLPLLRAMLDGPN